MRIFIAQPLFKQTTDEILNNRRKLIEELWNLYGKNIELIDMFQKFSHNTKQMEYLCENLKQLESCDLVYFAKDWESSNFCQMIHSYANLYHIFIAYENEITIRDTNGTVCISCENNNFIINGLNCSTDVLFLFSQFQPIIISSNSNKNKNINFTLAILNKYENLLLSNKFKEICKKKGISIKIDKLKIQEEQQNQQIMYEIFKGQELFKEKMCEKYT